MIKYERQTEILNYLQDVHTASVKEIAGKIYSSESSVRRDLLFLEQQGLLHRIYGGAVLSQYKNDIVPVELRDPACSAAKEQIAERAAQYVFDGSVIFMDSSSTVRRIVKYLDGKKQITVITNNYRLFETCRNPEISLYCTGGQYNRIEEMFIGPAAEAYVRSIHADVCFFSSNGIAENGDISDLNESLTSLRKTMLEHSERKIFLCDSSKLGVRKAFRLCGKDEVDDILCDVPLPWE